MDYLFTFVQFFKKVGNGCVIIAIFGYFCYSTFVSLVWSRADNATC